MNSFSIHFIRDGLIFSLKTDTQLKSGQAFGVSRKNHKSNIKIIAHHIILL